MTRTRAREWRLLWLGMMIGWLSVLAFLQVRPLFRAVPSVPTVSQTV